MNLNIHSHFGTRNHGTKETALLRARFGHNLGHTHHTMVTGNTPRSEGLLLVTHEGPEEWTVVGHSWSEHTFLAGHKFGNSGLHSMMFQETKDISIKLT